MGRISTRRVFLRWPRQWVGFWAVLCVISATLTIIDLALPQSVGLTDCVVSVTRSMQLLCIDCASGRFGLVFLRHGEDKKNFTDVLDRFILQRKLAASQ